MLLVFVGIRFFVFFYPILHLCLKQIFVRQIELVLSGVDVGILGQSQVHQRVFLAFTENDADGGFLKVLPHMAVVVVDVHLHLAKVLMGQLVGLQVNQHIALQQAVVEHKVDIVVLLVEGEPLLTFLEEEAFAKLQQERLQLADDGFLQFRLCIGFFRSQAQELQCHRILDDVRRLLYRLPFLGQAITSFLLRLRASRS